MLVEWDLVDMIGVFLFLMFYKGYISEKFVLIVFCLEVCDGKLCVFMLFVSYFEYYVLLLNVIEFIVDKFSIFVILEGYILFYDSCVEKFVVIFDLGVIEVNVYFVFDWYILVKNIYVFYVMVKLC